MRLHIGCSVHFHPSQFTRPYFSILLFQGSGSKITAPGAEESSVEWSRCLATQKAEAAWLSHFMYSSVCFDNNTPVKKHWRLGETWEWRISVTYTLALVCPVLMLGSTLIDNSTRCVRACIRPLQINLYFLWSSARIWFSWFNLWGLPSCLCEFLWRKWLLCSSEKRNGVLCICRPCKHLSSSSVATTTMSLSSRWTFWYITKATTATKGVICNGRDFIKGYCSLIVLISHLLASCKEGRVGPETEH